MSDPSNISPDLRTLILKKQISILKEVNVEVESENQHLAKEVLAANAQVAALTNVLAATQKAAPAREPISAQSGLDRPVGELLDEFIRHRETRSAGKKTAIKQLRDSVKVLREVFGDQLLRDCMTGQEFTRIEHAITNYPTNRNQPHNAGFRLAELWARGVPTIAVKTQERHVRALHLFDDWLGTHGGCGGRPSSFEKAIPMPRKTARQRAEERRPDFNDEHLIALFGENSPTFSAGRAAGQKQRRPHVFWAPMIALFTGARVSEIFQLDLIDVVLDVEVPHFRLCQTGGGRDKRNTDGKTGRPRVVPIHSVLLQVGLAAYVGEMMKLGSAKLLPGYKHSEDNGFVGTYSSKFSGHLKAAGIKIAKNEEEGEYGSKECFHGFRHTVLTRLRVAGVNPDIARLLSGHAAPSDAHEGYIHDSAERRGLSQLRAELERLQYPMLNFDRLKWSRARSWYGSYTREEIQKRGYVAKSESGRGKRG